MTYLEPCKFVWSYCEKTLDHFPALHAVVLGLHGKGPFGPMWSPELATVLFNKRGAAPPPRRPAVNNCTTLFFNGYVQLNTAEDQGTVRRTAVDQWHDCCNNTVECRDNCTDSVKLLMHTTTQLRADHKKTSFNQC